MEGGLAYLRSVVQDSMGKHMYDNAIFFADKLVSMSNADDDDVYRLCQALLFTRQYRRALAVMRNTERTTSSPRFRYVAAKCYAECQEWDQCLSLLDDASMEGVRGALGGADGSGSGRVSLLSSMLLLKGGVYEALENWQLAAKAYTAAVREEPLNFEALDRLVTNHMLPDDERRALLAHLEPRLEQAGLEWLRLYYGCRLVPELGKHLAEMHYAAEPPGSDAIALHRPGPFQASGQPPPVPGAAAAEAASASAALSAAAAAAAASPAAKGGPGCAPAYALQLVSNCDLMAAAAEHEYRHEHFRRCYALSSRVLAADSYHQSVLPVHICSMTRLGLHSELFALAHKLVEEYPQQAVSWFGVGCYYHMVGDFESARRYFSKATTLNHRFAPAWVGFGHAFAAQDESDQAMAAYRTASRLFPGSHVPWLGIGMEYLRTNHLPLALQYIRQAQQVSPREPLVLHELGVLHYHSGDFEQAADFFLQVAKNSDDYDEATREPSIFNLGHAYRKMKHFDSAITWYRAALAINPRAASTYSALGFTQHLKGDLHAAIELYHQSLSLKPDDTFTSEMLSEALKDSLDLADDPTHLQTLFAAAPVGGGAAHGEPSGRASSAAMDVSSVDGP